MVANKGRKAFEGAFDDALKGKVDKPVVHPGLLGAYLDDGRKVVTVPNRPDYVWVRIRGATSEPIQAFNDTVGRHFDLPVLVARDVHNPIRWKVIARDVGAYDDWGGGGYLPSHGLDHSFAGIPKSGSDITWVYKRQFMPLLPRPSSTGSKSIYVEAGYYFANGKYNWWPGSGSADFESFQPTGAYNSKFVTVYIDPDDGILQYTAGPEFNAYEPSGTFTNFIALPESEQGIPIAAVYLTSGTQWINWSEIYDLRLAPISTDVSSSGTVIVLADGVPLGSADSLNFSGPGFVTTISGSYAEIASDDWVEIAGDTMTGPLIIDGSADEVQLVIRANAAQSENILEAQDSGETALLAILGDGGISQTIIIPDTAARNINDFDVTFSGNYTTNDSVGTNLITRITSASPAGNRSIRGVRTLINVSTAWSQSGASVIGFQNQYQVSSSSSLTGLMIGNLSLFAISGGRTNVTVTDAIGFRSTASLGNQATNLVTNLKHFSVFEPPASPTVLVNQYGLHINSLTRASTLNYAIYTNAGLNRLGDQLVIVGSQDVVQQIVQRYETQTENVQEWQDSTGTAMAFVDPSGYGVFGEATKQPNAENLQLGGAWTFKETTEPAADAGYGKLWTEDDNILYFQDGDGVKHAVGGTPAFRSYSATTQGLAANPDIFVAGFYEWATADFNFTQAGTSGTFGTANISYAAHAFVVAAAAGTTDGSDLVLTVTGTSIDDQGNRVASDSEVIVADATVAATDQYFETTKKWLGQITFTLTSTGGGTFSFDFNYGLAKYDDWGNRDFTITDIEFVAFAGASDSDFDVLLLHHRTTGWTYSAAAFTPITAANTIASMAGDHSTDDQLNNSQHGSWKRDDLSTSIDGTGSDGFLILISSSANNAVEYINAHVGVLLR